LPLAARPLAILTSLVHNEIFIVPSPTFEDGMEIEKRFLRGLLFLSALALVLFSLEFIFEWVRHDRPGADKLSYAGHNENVKLVDVLSPTARAYNNILAMLIAAVGLAIPLTANMHTPKLIEMFLRDRVNRIVLVFGAIGAAHVLWVAYLIGPEFAPTWAYRLAVFGAVAGWVFLIPYFFYVIRFLDPSNILRRIKAEVIHGIDQAEHVKDEVGPCHDRVRDALHQIGTITIKSIDRADRGVAAEGVWCFKQLLDHYRKQKDQLPREWFKVERRDLVGLSPEALEILNTEGTWLEHAALWQMYLIYMNALTKAPDTLSALSDAVRVIGSHAAADNDERVLELAVRIFNNFLRETIKKKDLHAIYDLLYQYRRLALELGDRPVLLGRMGGYLRYYSELAVAAGMEFVPQILVFDLAAIVERAFEQKSPAASVLLRELVALRQAGASGPLLMVIKGKAIVGARLLEAGHEAEAVQLRTVLETVPREVLQRAEEDLRGLDERLFWEVTDRQVNLEWVPPERRDGLRRFFAHMRPLAA